MQNTANQESGKLDELIAQNKIIFKFQKKNYLVTVLPKLYFSTAALPHAQWAAQPEGLLTCKRWCLIFCVCLSIKGILPLQFY